MEPRKPRRVLRATLAIVLLLAVVAIRPARAHLRAASLLLRFADERAQGTLAELGRHAVDEEAATVTTSHGTTRARVYVPRGAEGAPGVVLVHGVHRLGIDEPRLQGFSRAVASSGVVVLTPEVKEIADYRVDPASIETIGAAARALRQRLGSGRAGVMGMSFAGGLSLLAAADPRFAEDIGFVVAIGAHHDLARVSRFFATDRVSFPDGSEAHLAAHHYGMLVLFYAHAARFFPPEDVDAARDAIRLKLWDQPDAARARAEALGPASWAKVDALLEGEVGLVAPEVIAEMDRARETMAVVSPSGHLGALRVPVFLLHGAGDTVIPAAETAWIASEVPPGVLRDVLVSPAIVHVELEAGTPYAEQWAIVHFMAHLLDAAEAARG
jgi:dienelactone hydrolase